MQSKCICRKPDSLLLEKAIARYKIDKDKTHFIGDMETDMIATNRAGVIGHLIESNSNIVELAKKSVNTMWAYYDGQWVDSTTPVWN